MKEEMIEKPQVYLSNSIETLIQLLRDQLFLADPIPFAKKIVFLPQGSLKNTLLTKFVSDGKLKVVFGVEFLELGSGLQTLFQSVTGKTLLFPPMDLLALHLEAHLENPGLALSLAKEFLRYGKFGGSFIKKWNDPWQKNLWDILYKKWNYPYQLLETPFRTPNEKYEVHLFNFPFLPKLYHLFFAKLTKFFPIHYYQFSPCKEFWSDSVTEYEKVRLIEKDPQLSLYLEEGNSLLKNLGKMGRETFRVFEEEDFIIEEYYQDKEEKSALTKLQNDILNYRKGKKEKDHSILLLPAPSKMREVEILYTKLLALKCLPSEIQIFAPDISTYAPLIEFVFGAEESPFDFTIRDLPPSPLIQTFYDLLTLNEKRFDIPSLFKLFGSPYFSLLNDKEVKTFRTWIDKSGVKWGVDSKHRKFLLPSVLDTSENGTWEETFNHLLDNLIFIPKEGSDWDLPYLDFSVSELLGKCVNLIRSLRVDLEHLQTQTLSAGEWCDHLLILFSRYLTCDKQDLAPFQEKLLLLKEIEAEFTFPSIKRYLANALKEKRGVRHGKHLESLTFSSLKPGAILFSKVIALLGMDEGAFPRIPISSSLNLLGKEGDYNPTTFDEDRYLFLEVLIGAQETLLITYQNVSEEDGKERSPSLLVQELDPQIETHPPFPFHQSYFKEPRAPYPIRYYRIAKTFYSPKKETPLIPEFLHPVPLKSSATFIEPTFEDLSRFAKNPLKFYCNKVLNLYLHYNDAGDEEFVLTPLQKYKLFLTPSSLEEAKERGHLPLGRFKEVAQKGIDKEWEEMTPHLPEKGFPFIGEGKFHELIKVYPLYLLAYLREPQPLVALKNGATFTLQSDVDKAYHDYLTYFQIALETPSPLDPQFANALLNKDAPAFASRIKNASTNPYIRAIFSVASHFDEQAIFETWSPLLRKTFAPLLEMIDEKV